MRNGLNFSSYFHSVACGMGHSMVIVDRTNAADRLDQVALKSTSLYFIREVH